MKEADVVRCKAVSCEQELNDALRLTAAAFKEEVSGSGMTAAQWVHFERRHLLRHTRPWDFPDIGNRSEWTEFPDNEHFSNSVPDVESRVVLKVVQTFGICNTREVLESVHRL